VKRTFFFVAACGLWACSSSAREPIDVKPVEQRVVHETPAPAAAPPPAAAPSEPATTWDKVKLEDQVPLCVFAGHAARGEAPFLKDVRKQTLHADSSLVFGAFSPGCQNEACDTAPTLQCWVDKEDKAQPNTLVVHSRLFYDHKRGTVCTEDCREVVAGCETPVLKAGKYTVKYGARVFEVRVPSVVRAPCFKLE
jgi:hypothetical protein